VNNFVSHTYLVYTVQSNPFGFWVFAVPQSLALEVIKILDIVPFDHA